MKIATWNIDRLQRKKDLIPIAESIKEIDADILVLTEYNKILELPDYQYKIETQKISENLYNYKETERRVSILSKFPIKRTIRTCDETTSCCGEFETNDGNLIVYGTIVGITGYADKNFKTDLLNQCVDIKTLSKSANFCYAGDLNISFSDNYYFTHFGRTNFLDCFKGNKLKNLTENIPENIDHIVLSENFAKNFNYEISEWNADKSLSDHKGICIDLKRLE